MKWLMERCFTYNNHVDFMADHRHNLATVQVAARCDGEKDKIQVF
jgi:hypothetical protein